MGTCVSPSLGCTASFIITLLFAYASMESRPEHVQANTRQCGHIRLHIFSLLERKTVFSQATLASAKILKNSVIRSTAATLARFCTTLSWRRNRTNVASEARPRFSTLSWYVNHVTSGLATVSRRSRFFSHLCRFVVRRDPHLFDLGTRGRKAHTFLCLEEGAKPHRGYLGFTSSQSAAKCCKTKT